MLTIVLSAEASIFLERIPKKHTKQIIAKIELLAENPTSVPSRQLAGYPMLRRIKSGEYRIIYTIVNEVLEVYILRIGKRNDGEVYRRLDNLKN